MYILHLALKTQNEKSQKYRKSQKIVKSLLRKEKSLRWKYFGENIVFKLEVKERGSYG